MIFRKPPSDIDMLRPGTARVRLKVIARPRDVKSEIKIEPSAPAAPPESAPARLPSPACRRPSTCIRYRPDLRGSNRAELLRATLEDIFYGCPVIAAIEASGA